ILDLHERAGAWRPEGGAPPWNWARMRVLNRVDVHIGQWSTSLDAEVTRDAASAAGGDTAVDEGVDAMMLRLTERHPLVALFDRALREVASERDRVLLIEVLIEEGSRSPAPSDAV